MVAVEYKVDPDYFWKINNNPSGQQADGFPVPNGSPKDVTERGMIPKLKARLRAWLIELVREAIRLELRTDTLDIRVWRPVGGRSNGVITPTPTPDIRRGAPVIPVVLSYESELAAHNASLEKGETNG